MTFQYNYAYQKFHQAVSALIGSQNIQESLQERLGSAYGQYLYLLKLEDIPNELQDDFKVIQELEIIELPNGSMSVKNLTDEQIDKLAEKILLMYDNLTQQLGTVESQYE